MSEVKIKVPEIGESIQEVTIGKWIIEDGQYVFEGDSLCEIESDKVSMELPAEVSGQVTISGEEEADYKIGDIIGSIDTTAKAPASKEEVEPKKSQAQSSDLKDETQNNETEPNAKKDNQKLIKTPSPAAKKILAEKDIDPSMVNGNGKDGRITKADALMAEAPLPSQEMKTKVSRKVQEQKMTRLRKTISKRLVEAKNTTAMLTTFNEVDMTEVMKLRKLYKEEFKQKHGVSLGFMSFFTRACCIALQEYPIISAIIDNENILLHNYADIGIAVSTPNGLVVPIIKNAESLSLAEIEKTVRGLAIKARDGKLTIDEMRGGNFTITNGGTFGSMLSTPILNIPQSAILGMHNIVERPHVVEGEIKIRPIMYLALSYDHRIIDGKDSVSFLVKVKEVLENPSKELFEKYLLNI